MKKKVKKKEREDIASDMLSIVQMMLWIMLLPIWIPAIIADYIISAKEERKRTKEEMELSLKELW